jgi:RNA-dependent RNA polymerase
MRKNNVTTAQWRANGHAMDHSRGQGFASRNQPRTPHGPPLILRQLANWQRCPELSIKIKGLPSSFTTWDLFRNFKRYGTIVFIELYESNGSKDGGGKIRFSPPPLEAFWNHEHAGQFPVTSEDGRSWTVYLTLDDRQLSRRFKIQSPIRKLVSYDEKMNLYPSALHFGLMLDQKSMMRMQTVQADTRDDMSFVVDLLKNRLVVTFMVHFKDPRAEVAANSMSPPTVSRFERRNKYMFQIPFGQLKTVHRVNIDETTLGLVISLESPPQFFRKRGDEKTCHSNENLVWSEFDSWYRQTDIVYNPYALSTATVALHKERPVIDIGKFYSIPISILLTSAGRWTTYQFIFNINQNDKNIYDMIQQALQDFNIEIISLNEFRHVPAHPTELWSLIDPPGSKHASVELRYLEGSEGAMYLPFEVRYQLEVCMSHEILNEYNITKVFVATLAEIVSKDPTKGRTILEYVAEKGQRIYDPMSIFEDEEALAFSPKTEIPHYCAFSRKATITPSTIYFNSPTVETTNRVLRHYARENKDGRFLRVQFTDEIFEVCHSFIDLISG